MAPQGGDSGTLTGGGYAFPSVGPPYGAYFRGPQGGPFNPSSFTYSMANFGGTYGLWQITFAGTNIFTASPSFGTLTANGGSVTINLSPNGPIANGMNGGLTYTEKVLFNLGTNTLTQVATLVVDAFYLTPTTNFISIGNPGGPFSPVSTIYTLSNSTPGTLSWSAFTSNTWDSLSASSGSLGGKKSTNITVSITSDANNLPYFGSYRDYIVFTNVSAGTQIATRPQVTLQVGFGVFDNFGDALEFTNGNVVGQQNWLGDANAVNPVQVSNSVYTVPGGCVNAGGTSQQPYKYVASGPLTNPCSGYTTNVIGGITNLTCINAPAYAIMGMLVTFTNAPSSANYVFGLDNSFLPWDDAGIVSDGGNKYLWTTELNRYETGGGARGNVDYTLGTQYQVFLVGDFVNSNAWVFVNPGTNDFAAMMAQTPAVWSWGGETGCTYCQGASPQAWTGIILGQYSACAGNGNDGKQPGYTVARVAASTNYNDVYTYIMAGLSPAPTSSFTNNPSSGSAPLTVNLYDTSGNSPTSWQWSSGDCSYSFAHNPSFIYSNAGTYYATLVAISQSGPSAIIATQTVTISACGAITLSPSSPLPGGTVGTAYSQTITASGGTAPYTYAVTAGSLAGSGLSLSSQGTLSGTPTTANTYTFTVTATDNNGCTGSQGYSVTITCPTITELPSSLPRGTVSAAYSQTITASGGTAPYTYAVTLGTVPTGLSLSSAGLLSGTPTTAGTYSFTVTATDTYGCTGSQAYSVTVQTLYESWVNSEGPAGGTLDANAAGGADPFGSGRTNWWKRMAGARYSNTQEQVMHIISIVKTNGTNIMVTNLGSSGDTNYPGGPTSQTNVLEYSTGTANGSYTNINPFTQVPGQTNVLGVGAPSPSGGTGMGTQTNMMDVGGATAGATRYYRVRVLP
jgi:PKD repeat protein